MTYKLADLETEYRLHKAELDAVMQDVAARAAFILGEDLAAFEDAFARFASAPFCCGVKSGTAALELAIRALVPPGSEVVVPSITFVATAGAAARAGARPVFADVDPESFVVTAESVRRALTPDTRGVVVVHLHGNMPDMHEIQALCDERELVLIEDCAQAHGATFDGRMAGTLGRAGCFSFFPAKVLGGFGDGGAIVTSDAHVHQSVRRTRDHGRVSKHVSAELGTNERLDSLQAAILRAKLARLPAWLERRRAVARIYDDAFDACGVRRQRITGGVRSAYCVYSILVPRRDELAARLREKGIQTGVHYPVPVNEQAPFRDGTRHPGASAVARDVLSIPVHPYLSDADAKYIACEVVKGIHEIRAGRVRDDR